MKEKISNGAVMEDTAIFSKLSTAARRVLDRGPWRQELGRPDAAGAAPADGPRQAALPGWFGGLLALYVVLGVLLLPHYLCCLDRDATGYISEARKFAAGHFMAAVNGHWSPLLPLTLAPLLKLGLAEPLAIKLHCLVTGLLTLVGAFRLSFRFRMSPAVRVATWATLVGMTLYYALIRPTPDLLVVGVLCFYLDRVFDPRYGARRWDGLACGLLGACGYFAKAYMLPLFGLHFTLMSLFHFLRAPDTAAQKRVGAHYALGLAVCALVSLPWIAALSVKYHGLTITTAGKNCMNMRHPDLRVELVPGLGFWPPAHPDDLSAWDDPASLPDQPWSPWASWDNFTYAVGFALRNAAKVVMHLQRGSILSAVIAALSLLILAAQRDRWRAAAHWILPLVTLLVFPSGYVPMDVTEQYLWIMNVIILLLGGQLLTRLLAALGGFPRAAVLALCCASFLVHPLRQLARYWDVNRELPGLAQTLGGRYHIGGRLASHNRYFESLLVAFFLKAQYCNVPRPDWSEETAEKRLAELDVQYYLVWADQAPAPRFVERYPEVTQGQVPGLKVFALRAAAR